MSTDTSPEAAYQQTLAQRRLGPQGRFLTTCRMSETLHQLALQRIKRQDPSLDERGAMARLVFERYGHSVES
ncbi:MAG: hypothetical protein K8J08_07585 [Thermoanaerobaculia bacterium]|nr:hypothetical protein [Thermoanaerobaculia bacterium]